MSWLSGPCVNGPLYNSDGEQIGSARAAREEVEQRVERWKTYDDAIEEIEQAAAWPNRED